MKINKKVLQESLEEYPDSFITTFISDGWDKVSLLKGQIEGIKEEFKDVDEVIEILQDLTDAYLVSIGRFEALLSDRSGIEVPKPDEADVEKKDEAETEDKTEDDTTPVIKVVDKEAPIDAPTIKVADADDATVDAPTIKVKTDNIEPTGKPFEFFVDEFPEVDVSEAQDDDNPFRPARR